MRIIQLSTLKEKENHTFSKISWMKMSPKTLLPRRGEIFFNVHVITHRKKFYRKFYSTYNIFQQKKAIYRKRSCTLRLQKQNKILEKKCKIKCELLILSLLHSKLDTRLALAPKKRKQSGDWNKTTHNEYQHQWNSLADSPNKINLQVLNCTC